MSSTNKELSQCSDESLDATGGTVVPIETGENIAREENTEAAVNYKEKYEATLQGLEKNKEMYQKYITQIEDDHEKANEEKEKEITSLRQTIKGYQNVDAHKNRINEGGRLYNCDENIRIKPKAKKSNQNVTINNTEYFNCEYSECNMSNVDSIKCYSCVCVCVCV